MKQRMRSAWQLWRGQARTAKLCLALAALSVAAALLLSSGTLCYAVSSQDLVREQAITPAAQPTRQLTGAESPGIQTTATEPTEPAETPPEPAPTEQQEDTPPADASLRDGFKDFYAFKLDGLTVIVRKFKQIPVPGGRDGVLSIWRQILFRDLPTFQRLASYLVISGKADPCTVFPEMQIAFIVDKVDRFFYLLHQHPPSNSSENLLRPSASQDSSTVAL